MSDGQRYTTSKAMPVDGHDMVVKADPSTQYAVAAVNIDADATFQWPSLGQRERGWIPLTDSE